MAVDNVDDDDKVITGGLAGGKVVVRVPECLVNAVEATDWPLSSRKRKLPRHQLALATLQTGSSIEEEDDDDTEEHVDDELLEDPDEVDKDCISMSMQVAVTVDVVPNILNPLSSFPLGSYSVLGNLEYGDSGVKTTLG